MVFAPYNICLTHDRSYRKYPYIPDALDSVAQLEKDESINVITCHRLMVEIPINLKKPAHPLARAVREAIIEISAL